MIKRFFIIAVLLCSVFVKAQNNTSSPYSYYGIGLSTFKGTAENRSMAGLSIASDSIHVNLQNPAGYGKLALTTYTVGVTHDRINVRNNSAEDKVTNTSLDYLALAFPAGKLGFGLGIVPFSSVGYELREENDQEHNEYSGKGGLNKLFVSAGYRFDNGLRLGVEGSYNFGDIQNKTLVFQRGIQYGTREENRSDLSGFKVNFGAQYEKMLNEKLQLTTSVSYSPAAGLTSENTRDLSSVYMLSGQEVVAHNTSISLANTTMKLPSEFRLGAGIGQPRKWFAGVEYQNVSANDYNNRSYVIDNVDFKNASTYRLGGYYIPNYNDITSYFKRIVLRGGLRYQETGLVVNNKSIDEFGISFGVGLPAGSYLTNINIGAEYGKRGTKAASLVEEKFFSLYLSFSLNDKWFQKRKYD